MTKIIQQINQDLILALKTKNQDKATLLRTLKAALQNAEIEKKQPLTDQDTVLIIQKEVKKREEAVSLYEQAGRNELAQKEKAEIQTLKIYLPEQMSDAELEVIVRQAITETGANCVQDIGKVMGQTMGKVAGRADGSRVAAKVRELLRQK